MSKITTAQRLRMVLDEVARAFDASHRRVVLAHGCFDILHPGHLRHLEYAKAQGDVLVVSVTTDAWVNKGPGRPYVPDHLRADVLAALTIVDYVTLTPGDSAADVIRTLKPDVFAKGADYSEGRDERTIREMNALKEYGGRMVFTPGGVVFSSTELGQPRVGMNDTMNTGEIVGENERAG
jgi:rfaE bifunctional protein nucleotidyltransferase chain/domain